MELLEQVRLKLESRFPGAAVTTLTNESPSKQNSLVLPNDRALEMALFMRDDSELRFDYLSNVTGVDWPDTVVKEKVKTTRNVGGVDQVVEETVERRKPGYLEVVYHLYSVSLKHGPVVFRLRTQDRISGVEVPSMTPVWRGAEFQEREVYDLFGVKFAGHPDLRRLLMWEGFQDFPMRKDYVDPDDYEYEPTPHDEVLEKARRHYPEAGANVAAGGGAS